MIPLDEAIARVLRDVPAAPEEQVPLAEAHGRVLARDVVAPFPVPPWDNSAMDGFAVRSADPEGARRVVEDTAAGRPATQRVGPGEAIALTTGSPLPDGADAVVPVERAHRDGDSLLVDGPVRAGDHVRPAGEDLAEGATVLHAGTTLTPAQVGLIASTGAAEVAVARRPVVSVLVTGDELVAPGQPRPPGAIYSSNDVVLAGLIARAGGVPRTLGIAPDDLDGLCARLEHALDGDLVLTTGGVSVGTHDLVKAALARVGVEPDFWKVAIKPGKPVAFGRARRRGRLVPVLSLPGNPVANAVLFHQLARPWIRTHLGDPRPFLPRIQAVLTEPSRGRPGRTRLERVVLSVGPEGVRASRAGHQGSGRLSSLARGHGLAILGPGEGDVPAGTRVEVQVLDLGFLDQATPAAP